MEKLDLKTLDLVPRSFFIKGCAFRSPECKYYVETWSEDGWDMDLEFRSIAEAYRRKHRRIREGRIVRITDGDGCML